MNLQVSVEEKFVYGVIFLLFFVLFSVLLAEVMDRAPVMHLYARPSITMHPKAALLSVESGSVGRWSRFHSSAYRVG
ncbi:MAG: hypothetical protein IKK67_00940 [Bacteroidaceae bacterium]|nr:hypothetical protein [Bacteroidaceae bacterium]